MGSRSSKNRTKDYNVELFAPNINFMRENYGDESVKQIWVTECGFPSTGSFSIRQLNRLRERLQEKKKRLRIGKARKNLQQTEKHLVYGYRKHNRGTEKHRQGQIKSHLCLSVPKCRIPTSTVLRQEDAATHHNNMMNQEPKSRPIGRLTQSQRHHHHTTMLSLHLLFPSPIRIQLT